MDDNPNLMSCTGQTGSYIIHKNDGLYTNFYIYIEKGKDSEKTFIHEIGHLVFHSLRSCGIEATSRTDEVYCYYLEWWYKKLKDIIKS